MRTDKEWMREDTWHFEVEVLIIYGRQELWSHGFGASPVSDGPYQPVDAADVWRRVAFGARHQDNEFAVRHCCVHRSRWSVAAPAPSLPLPAGGPGIAAAHSPAVGPTSTRATDQLRLRAQLSSWLEDVECGRHKPLEPQIGPRPYTTSLRLHQPRLIPSTWRGGTLRDCLCRHTMQVIQVAMTRSSIAYVSRSCRVGWKMPSAPATGLSSLELGPDSTPQVYAYANRG
ncbi:hypothetical protein THAOC_17097 [Thalassiosira oceanica]|uniref:DUF6743 domain-containing protein n=1 Tax=Thalassiosira oceanica TaxID=159749 RepID=K0SMY0_THAOC|nr:hypothetical protein THAOC_17097 [Thalassiosira oceanica]|eukprot:EJK62296.1 hypothetical protein THAOC_17097 [Thalassiosira oceanica]